MNQLITAPAVLIIIKAQPTKTDNVILKYFLSAFIVQATELHKLSHLQGFRKKIEMRQNYLFRYSSKLAAHRTDTCNNSIIVEISPCRSFESA